MAAKKTPSEPAKNAGGRPLLLDDAMIARIAEAKRGGLPDARAAAFVLIDESTLRGWKAKGAQDVAEAAKDPDGSPATTPHARLIAAMEKARSDFLAASLLRIQQAGRGGAVTERTTVTVTHADGSTTTTTKEKVAVPQWTADAWLAERSFPDDFGRTDRVQLSGPNGGPVQVDSWAGIAALAERGKSGA